MFKAVQFWDVIPIFIDSLSFFLSCLQKVNVKFLTCQSFFQISSTKYWDMDKERNLANNLYFCLRTLR